MSTIVTRSGKGSPLTNSEIDNNFSNLNTDKAELSGAAFTGAITTNSTFDGRDVAVDGAKLDGIEVAADVTDAANVTAAGALMDSEVTNLAEVKAFSSSDYATAAQGTTADAALPKSGGTMTGALVLNNTGSVKVSAGTTAQRESSPSAGMFRFNSTEGKFEGYSTEWGEIGGGGAFNDFVIKTADYIAVTKDQIIVDSASAVTITLPASPSAGNIVFIENSGAGTVTVARNGSNINSTADNGELATNAGATLVYVNGTIGWREL
jgi:hypothetical protein